MDVNTARQITKTSRDRIETERQRKREEKRLHTEKRANEIWEAQRLSEHILMKITEAANSGNDYVAIEWPYSLGVGEALHTLVRKELDGLGYTHKMEKEHCHSSGGVRIHTWISWKV